MKIASLIIIFVCISCSCYGQLHSEQSRTFIKQAESLSLAVYMDGQHRAVGYGHHIRKTDPIWLQGLKVGDCISREMAELLFEIDMLYMVEPALRSIEREIGYGYPGSVYDSFASLVYNMGPTGFKNTRFYKKFVEKEYVKALLLLPETAVSAPGLYKRRIGELKLLTEHFDFETLTFKTVCNTRQLRK